MSLGLAAVTDDKVEGIKMRIAEVLGTVTLSRWHRSLPAASWRLIAPLTHDELAAGASSSAEVFVTYDDLGAGHGDWILISEGPEAAQAFRPAQVPIDCYNAGILDEPPTIAPRRD